MSLDLIARGIDRFSQPIRSGARKSEASISQLEKTSVSSGSRMVASFKQVGTSLAALGGLEVLRRGFISVVTEASDLEESINAVNVVFKDGADEILAFGESAATSVGLAASEFNQLSTTTGALLQDVGLPMEQVSELTIDLTKRAADLASVFNTDVKDALSAVNQAIRGETEAIRRYAGDVTDATLETFRLSEGMDTSVKSMTQQEKRLLRVKLLLEQTSVAAGDFAETQGSLANQIRIFNAEIQNFSAELGETFLEPLTKLIQGTRKEMLVLSLLAKGELSESIRIANLSLEEFVRTSGKLSRGVSGSWAEVVEDTENVLENIRPMVPIVEALSIATEEGVLPAMEKTSDTISGIVSETELFRQKQQDIKELTDALPSSYDRAKAQAEKLRIVTDTIGNSMASAVFQAESFSGVLKRILSQLAQQQLGRIFGAILGNIIAPGIGAVVGSQIGASTFGSGSSIGSGIGSTSGVIPPAGGNVAVSGVRPAPVNVTLNLQTDRNQVIDPFFVETVVAPALSRAVRQGTTELVATSIK